MSTAPNEGPGPHENRTSVTLDRVILDPARYFASPADVLASAEYSRAERRRILERWLEDAKRLDESAGEGMQGGESSRLREIELVLAKLAPGRST